MNQSHIPSNPLPPVMARRRATARIVIGAGLIGLLTLVIVHTVWAWRYFPMLLGDQGWYLQVAARVSQGEVLYRDVAWAYGPLPVQFLAFLLRTVGPQAGLATANVCRRHGISSATFYKWKSKYGGLEVSEARRLRALEDENAQLNKLLAEAMLDNVVLKDLASKKW